MRDVKAKEKLHGLRELIQQMLATLQEQGQPPLDTLKAIVLNICDQNIPGTACIGRACAITHTMVEWLNAGGKIVFVDPPEEK